MVRRGRLIPAYLAFTFNIVILSAVVADADWVRTRAAGGTLSAFPGWLRLIYALQLLLLFFLVLTLNRTPQRWGRLLAWVFTASTFAQLASRSADERWNAIPAAVIAGTYFALARQD